MANFKKHFATGAVVGGTANVIWQLLKIYGSPDAPKDFWDALSRIDLGTVAMYAAGGAVIASLPDILEPARHPNHRSVFHSLSCGTAVSYAAFGKHSQALDPEDRHTVQVLALSYLSHLFLDAGTPKGLPLI